MLDDFSRVLRFKPHLLVRDAGPGALYVVDEFRRSVLPGDVFPALAACIRDGLTIAQTFATLAARFSEWEVLAALDHLVRRGYVRADAPSERDAAIGFFERTGIDGDAASGVASRLAIAVEAFGVEPRAQLDAFAACGIDVVPDAPMTIALTDGHGRAGLIDAAERAAARGGALFVVAPDRVEPLLGPLIGPLAASPGAADAPPCIECVRYWTALNRPVEALLARVHGGDAARLPPAHSRASAAAVAALVASFVEQLAVNAQRRRHAGSHIVSLRIDTLATAAHRVVRRPQCPRCGNPAWMREQAERPVTLAAMDGGEGARREGGYRTLAAGELFKRYGHLISPVSGPIAYLHPMPARNAGMRHVYVAGYLVCPQSAPRENRFDKLCSGKGASDAQARASALAEALERFSGVYQGDEATLRGSLAELSAQAPPGGGPIDVNALQQYSDRQFERRERHNATTDDPRKQVPQRFTPHSVIDWTPAWSIATGVRRLVPLGYCYAEAPASSGAAYCVHNPNGCAAGACIEEAILQGLLELVERDAVAIWWYNELCRPSIDIASFGDPYFDALVAEYASFGWRLWALDITHDLRIPVFVALAREDATGRFSIGFGCHLDSRIALQRALTEVNQLLDVGASAPPPWDVDKLSSDAFLHPDAALPPTRATGATSAPRAAADLKGDIGRCVARLSAAGIDTLVVDKTRPDIGLPVVQVIAPGLCHFWPRFGARRLYSVPVLEGWRERPRDEDELNRALLFL
ncbi:TOMM precursor leader peptide-binding protein [Burkholderia oklahomensis]|uniref:TOMM precursor leader peptide-binding protein n=1 Tax=Burkholderia oklahomensis TaxID=342113 RepID=UPI00016A6D76|nr:TOMM precursor leader peptide-binding protein [Burkholderia oklahomensis]AJX33243.1 bacteriocin biosynthesis cyclodehydratase domain protein [Burkholderia oklahomensis C6786]AOI47830.1 bacteriocin biosynthesis cyclodehydratase [Burkholderia oklahomensis C6786]KUY60031.1 bacteriocin biosynthesis cyclodehydratase [Burkholderia oklahomensis C6786]MBI0360200.1 TOMM precursor leader peptide-binding protein [Burkholderia oklahomensis]SUW59584.1 bacteriocin biosynthesis docking scaffold, SagD fami